MKKTLYILLFIFATVGITQSCETSTDNKQEQITKPSVEFLSKSEAAVAILDESYEPYFSILQIREIQVLTGKQVPSSNINEARDFARKEFSSAVSSFSKEEKSALLMATSSIKSTFHKQHLDIIAYHPWKFIKIQDWLCGGYAHTRGDCIILSQRHLDHLISDWSDNMSKKDSLLLIKKLGSLLVHEQFHSLQRQYPTKFDSLYIGSWGFQKTVVEEDSAIIINQLTNPDAPKAEWIVSYGDDYYWVRTLIKADIDNPQMGKDFIDVVFTLENKNDKFAVMRDSLNNIEKQRLSDFTQYTSLFAVTQGLDHPNEISAYMFSKYYVSIMNGEPAFNNAAESTQSFSKEFINWLNNEF